MKTVALLPIGLAIVVAVAQTAPTAQKTIKDAAEYNEYMAALNTTAPGAKAAAMEAFIHRYPKSVVKVDALKHAMAAYQQMGDEAKVGETAGRIVDEEPDNVRALAVLTAIDRAQAAQKNAAALARLGDLADRGLKALPQWQDQEGMPDADYGKLKTQLSEILEGAAGFAALQKKDYAAARGHYLKSVEVDPTNLENVYQLAIAELEMTPLDTNGFWHAGRAWNLAQRNDAARKSIDAYASAKYRRFHGDAEGWAGIVTASANQAQPPAGFKVSRAPSPAELAVIAVRENDPGALSISDWEYVLSYRDASAANKEAAEKVWQTIQAIGKNGQAKMKLPVKVIAASSTSIQGAISDENQKENTADLEVTLARPLTKIPAAGSMVDVIGVMTDYRLIPFRFVMKDGEVAVK